MEDCEPSGIGLRGRGSNHPAPRWLKTLVVSGREKARLMASGGDQEVVPGAIEVLGVRCLWDMYLAHLAGVCDESDPVLQGLGRRDGPPRDSDMPAIPPEARSVRSATARFAC